MLRRSQADMHLARSVRHPTRLQVHAGHARGEGRGAKGTSGAKGEGHARGEGRGARVTQIARRR